MAQSLEAKIVVLGAQGVGKTSLVHRYVRNHFQPTNITSTVGASFLTKRVIDDESDTVVRLQIWDTAGQERFRSISRLYYRGANACILCYSITDSESFTEMGVWLLELRRNLPPDIILHVVGTKSDLVTRNPSFRQVPFERCIAYVAENLAPGMGGTPPASAGAGERWSENRVGIFERAFSGAEDARSPSSKRSSGFWGQEIGWDCCHEVSAESGEGIDEVFRVITRKLVNQNFQSQEGPLSRVQSPGMEDSENGESGIYPERNAAARSGGSFRVGRDRRSWFGVPVESFAEEVRATSGETENITRRKGKGCC
ncbi:BgTH12-04416 [Blumeria graminis f. sp. triticale]|uniref:Bgt-1897 n=3 Tax=Blumeria graminis TaxID=34373 RepID=A0A061HIW1_BLUGR|nr:GTPase [Blumeria graminis f. sp. tritici 96224]CAD6498755.1 BgTH12-04416 [Blumeria graminis f. sp. triticale]VCU38851.1 Bgt-1897 [Blumeria graminis f. sp. tritici]